MAESKEKLKSLLMKVKEESEKDAFNLNIQKSKIMATGPITSWLIDGEKNGNSDTLYFLGFQNHWGLFTEVMKLRYGCSLEEKLWQN